MQIRECIDSEECSRIWQEKWPQGCLFDLWPVRECFASSYKRQPFFLLAEEKGRIEGVLALSWVKEAGYYAFFPGETWQDKTWLEQNRIITSSPDVFSALLESVPGPTHLRYLTYDSVLPGNVPVAVDEVGYLFIPSVCNYSFEDYMQKFSGKSRKKLSRELSVLENQGVEYRFDRVEDIRFLFRMNLEVFGETSYFYNPSFLDSFEKLIAWLFNHNMLRITTLMIGGQIAAVDIGAIWQKSYTILAGATNPEFPGVAKMINFHHLDRSCRERFDVVDFLCGDFGWKRRFHLSDRPLYELHLHPETNSRLEAGFAMGKINEL